MSAASAYPRSRVGPSFALPAVVPLGGVGAALAALWTGERSVRGLALAGYVLSALALVRMAGVIGGCIVVDGCGFH